MLQPVTNLPDHGRGGLGKVAHGVLTASLAHPPDFPRLYLGYNTMPDPPVRMPTYLAFDADASGWSVCGQSIPAYLRAVEAALREQPMPPRSAYADAYHLLARTTRVDAIALAYSSGPDGSAGSADAEVVLAVDRSRASAMLWAPSWNEQNAPKARPRRDPLALALERAGIRQAYPDPAEAELHVADGGLDEEVTDALVAILRLQYAWTRTATALTDSDPL